MTVELLEGLMSSIGDELTEIDGFRSTRASNNAEAETRIQTGVGDATSADSGTTVTFTSAVPDSGMLVGHRFRLLSDALATTIQSGVGTATSYDGGQRIKLTSGSFSASVQPGRRFKATSGPYSGKFAFINERISSTEILLAAPWLGIEGELAAASWSVLQDLTNRSSKITVVSPGAPGTVASLTLDIPLGGNFTAETWEVVEDPDTSISVETTLDWTDSGTVVVDGVRYRYDSKTLTSLDAVRPETHLGKWGVIICPVGASIVHGEEFTIDDGQGRRQVFSFYIAPGDEPTVDKVQVEVTVAMTADQVRDAVIDAITLARMDVVAFANGTGRIELWHTIDGGDGFIDVTDTVAAAGFKTQGARGVATDVDELTEIVDYTRNYSAFDQYYRSFVVDHADGQDLDMVGRNVGVPRNPALASDLLYRRLVQAIAYAPRGTIYAMELALEALLGAGNFEIFENLTDGSPLQEPCDVFFRRITDNTLKAQGKTFIEGEEIRQIASSTSITTADTPVRVVGLRLADEPVQRRLDYQATNRDAGTEPYGCLVDFGTGATSADGVTVTLSAGSFSSRVQTGDIFVIESGSYTGSRAPVRTPGTPLTLYKSSVAGAPLEGCALHSISVAFSAVRWRIIRPISNFRYYKPSADACLYTPTTAVTIWSYIGTNEGTAVTLLGSSSAERSCRLAQNGAETIVAYEHKIGTTSDSDAALSMRARIDPSSLSTSATSCRQAALLLLDGEKYLGIGSRKDGSGNLLIGAIDSSGSHIGTPINLGASYVFRTYAFRKSGIDDVEFLVDGVVVQTTPRSSFSSSAVSKIQFGVVTGVAAGSVTIDVKYVDFKIRNYRDFLNAQVTAGSTASGTPKRVSGGSYFLATDDDRPHQKRVRIRSVTSVNGGDGSAIGEWDVDAYVSSSAVDLMGPKKTGMYFNANFPKRVFVHNDPRAFVFPHTKGHKLIIESGPSAGSYTINKIIDPNNSEGPLSAASLDVKFPTMISSGDLLQLPTSFSNVLEVTTDLPSPGSTEVVNWHLEPVFPTDAAVVFELIDAASVVGTTITLRQALPASITTSDWAHVEYVRVNSAHIEDEYPIEIQVGVNNATSVDGVVVTFPSGTLTGTSIHVGMMFEVFDITTATGLAARRARIAAVGPGDQITLEDEGLGAAFTNLRWKVLASHENDSYDQGEYLIWPFYLYDDLGYVRDVLSKLTVTGVLSDFDRLYRDTSYETGVEGLHLLPE